MSMQTELQAALDDIYTMAGEAATYTPKTGSAVSVLYMVESSKAHVEIFFQSDARVGIITIRKSQLAAVHIGDAMTIAGAAWRVADIIGGELDALEWVLAIQKDV